MPARNTSAKKTAAQDAMVVTKTEEGFRVYALASPMDVFRVTGSPEAPHCDCPDFREFGDDPGYRCRHIEAALRPHEDLSSSGDPELTPLEHKPPEPAPMSNGNSATMHLKRSVSPDGRIDSLSVEVSFPVGKGTMKDVKTKAEKTLKLQGEIVQKFLGQTDSPPPAKGGDKKNGNGAPENAEPAQMLEIGGINTKWGRRLFIAFQVNGDTFKLFGNRNRLAEALTAVGRPKLAEQIEEGLKINVPCLVTTKESGQYTNVDGVFPAEKLAPSRGKR